MASSRAMSVQIRLRPRQPSDGPNSPSSILLSENTVSVPSAQGTDQRLKFNVNTCHGEQSTQESIYESIKPVIEQVYRGINTTVFAYGVTGSGKTWTMQGTPKDPGIIPRVVKSLFLKRSRLRKSSLKISISYVEILIEEIYDLLVARGNGSGSSVGAVNQKPKKLDIRTTSGGENVVADLTRVEIGSVAEFEVLYSQASQCRKTASTALNSSSSRSHAILSIYVETTDLVERKTFMGKICLVDLAGSEDNKLTGNDPIRMRESSAINRSLINLGNVVEALNTGAGRVPYRDSKLTRMLQDALGGTSVGMLICNLAPGEKFAKDTLRTLKFASRTKEIENRVMVNERDHRVHPKPHYSAPNRPTVKTSLAPIFAQSSTLATQASALTSLPAPCGSRPPSILVASSMMGNVRSQIESSAMGLIEDELKSKIEDIVKQVIEPKEKEHAIKNEDKVEMAEGVRETTEKEAVCPEAGPSGARRATAEEPTSVIPQGLTDEEVRARAKVLVNLGRKHQDGNEIPEAIRYYCQAKAYLPDNQKLTMRIAELQLAMEGSAPVPERAAAKKQAKVKATTVDKSSQELAPDVTPAPGKALSDITNGSKEQGLLKTAKTVALTKAKKLPKGQKTAQVTSEDKENAGAAERQVARKKLLGKWAGDGGQSEDGGDSSHEEYIPDRKAGRRLGITA